MKKIFRFEYEQCSGTCYHPSPEFFTELRAMDHQILNNLINKIQNAHDSTCDDKNQRFGVDYCEDTKVYVASFIDNGRLDLFSDQSFVKVTEQLCNFVLKQNKDKVPGKEDCLYGQAGHENLADVILAAV